jgi:hypothetical protein
MEEVVRSERALVEGDLAPRRTRRGHEEVPGPGALDVPRARVESAHPNTSVRFAKTSSGRRSRDVSLLS